MARPQLDILEYSSGEKRSRKPFVTGFEVLISFCLGVAIAGGVATFVQMAHRPWTPQYRQYAINKTQQEGRSLKPIPPFVGQVFVSASIWDYATTYIAAVALVGFVVVTMIRLRLWWVSCRNARAG
jgi:hypothetical protein